MGKEYRTREEVISAFEGFLKALPLNFYDKGINDLPLKWQKRVLIFIFEICLFEIREKKSTTIFGVPDTTYFNERIIIPLLPF